MYRETIDFGIDLGTTNSSIAVWGSDGHVEVIKNLDQSQSTPSVVSTDSKNRVHVGIRAKNRVQVDPANVHMEFKQQMGRDTQFVFPINGQSMSPEQLSGEVMKSLKSDVQRRFAEDLRASVITIPAAFDKAEIAATNKAAALSGLAANPLCLEPIAAALAYGHKSASENGFWLVFDFGGGTFDSAVVQLKDEEFQIVNHTGDNFLGGKLIDWALLDQILIPSVQKEFNLPDFSRTSEDPAVQVAIAKLKLATEEAKVQLSSQQVVDVFVSDRHFGDGEYEYELSRDDLNRMAEPFVLRAINLCKQVLGDKRLRASDVERLILVGGPTQMPIFREMLADPDVGLGIPLEYSVDPMTVVAQGAAIFARTQRLPRDHDAFVPRTDDIIGLQLEYEPAGPDDDPDVAGRLLLDAQEDLSSYTIQFSKSDWNSGRVRISRDGAFSTVLYADKGDNDYLIEVQDATGQVRKTMPERIGYLRKPVFREIPLIDTIQVARADNSADPIFSKGMALPLRKPRDYTQTILVNKGQDTGEVRIPIVEGSNERADRNKLIGYLTISPSEVKRDVPPGSSIEFQLSVDESNILTASAYIPVLDQNFSTVINPEKPEVDTDRLRKDAEAEIERMSQLEDAVEKTQDAQALAIMGKIKEERTLEEVESALERLAHGGDAEDLLLNRLRNLRIELDKVETFLEWPKLVAEAEASKRELEELFTISKHAEASDKTEFVRLCKELEHALEAHEPELLRRVISELDDIIVDMLHRNPANWHHWFEEMCDARQELSDQGLVDELIAQGHRAIAADNFSGLRSVVQQLWRQRPSGAVDVRVGLGGTVQ